MSKNKPTENNSKKPFYKRKWFIALVVIVIIGGIGANLSDDNSSSNSSETQASEEKTQKTEKPLVISVSKLEKALEENALKAEETYQDKYVEITGKLDNIDSDGEYISLTDPDDEFDLMGIQCYIKNDEQRKHVSNLKTGDSITLRGTITDIGEVMGYSVDIKEFK